MNSANITIVAKTRLIDYRITQLKGIKQFLKECEAEIFAALKQDMEKPEAETLAMEIAMLGCELNFALKISSNGCNPNASAPP